MARKNERERTGGRKSSASEKAGSRKGAAGRKTTRGAKSAGVRKGGARKSGGARKTAARKAAGRKSEAREMAQPRGSGRRPATKSGRGGARRAGGRGASGRAGAGRREGAAKGRRAVKTSDYSASAQRALWIESPNQHAERPGQTLATRNHDVILQWAEERGAVPATISGTERDGRPGVLRFDFPDFAKSGGRLRQVDWDEWFETFDARKLVFLFQEEMKDGRQSNFFRLDSPFSEEG